MSDSLNEAPKVYRVMKRDPSDNLPVVGSTNSAELGVRPSIDIIVNQAGNVEINAGGMSVAPQWRDLEFTRIPKRLRPIVRGAIGSNSSSCYKMGVGPFESGVVAEGLVLIPDEGKAPVTHGVIAPIQVVSITKYQMDLEKTRNSWQIDET